MRDHHTHQAHHPHRENHKRIFYQLLTRVGNNGKYQKYALFIVYLINFIGCSTFFVNPFLFYQKPYVCNGSISSTHCNKFVCHLPPSQRLKYEPHQAVSSLGNINSSEFCNSIGSITLMQQSIFAGAFFGVVLVGIFSDAIGRKKTVLYSMLLSFAGIVLIVAFQDLIVKCIGFLFWGIGSDISFAVVASYLTEIVAEQQRPNTYVKFNIAFAAGVISNTIIFYLFRNWFYIMIFFYALGYLLLSIAFSVYVQSPPIQIISHIQDPHQSYRAFMRMAEKNEVSDHGITLEQIREIHMEYHQSQQKHAHYFTFADICRYKSLRGDFTKVSFGFFIVMLLQYAPILLMQKLVPNIFISGFANGISQFATIPFLPYLNKNMSRRRSLMAMFTLTTIFTFFQYLIDPLGCISCMKGFSLVLLMTFFFISRFFINMTVNFYFNSMNQSFPAQVRSICYCGIVSVGRGSSLLIPFLPVFSKTTSIPLNIIFTAMGLIGIFSSWMLRQTINIPPPQIIEELKEEESSDSKSEERDRYLWKPGMLQIQQK